MCQADNDVMFRPGFNAQGMEVYEYVLVYSDYFLVVALDPKSIIDKIDGKFKLKEGSTGQPTLYLGATIAKYQVEDGAWAWSMSSDQYVKASLEKLRTVISCVKETVPEDQDSVCAARWLEARVGYH
jgi:hypothetical protein